MFHEWSTPRWLHSPNTDLKGKPADLRSAGFGKVCSFYGSAKILARSW